MVKIAYTLLIFLSLVFVGTKGKTRVVDKQPIAPLVVSMDWLKEACDRYPEMQWLADDNVFRSEENVAIESDQSYSLCLYKKYYPEFDRTALSLKAFKTFYKGDYKEYLLFTYKQDPIFRLSYKTFKEIQHFFQTTLGSLKDLDEKGKIELMECLILFCDLGKSSIAQNLATEIGICEPNHNLFFSRVIQKRPDLFPSYAHLSTLAKQHLIALAKQPQFGYMTHFEGGIELFQRLEESNFLDEPELVNFAFMAHICDVAGAQGHVEPTSSINYNEKTHQLLMDIFGACNDIPQIGSSKAWNRFLQKRNRALEIPSDGVLDQVILRISSMMRFTIPYEVSCLKKALFQMPPETLEQIIDAFSWENRIDTRYLPAVMLNLLCNPALGESFHERLDQAVFIGLPCLANSIHRSKKLSRLNFNPIAKIAKEDPQALRKTTFIDEKGFVFAHKANH